MQVLINIGLFFKSVGMGIGIIIALFFIYITPIVLPVLAGMLTYEALHWLFYDESFSVYRKLFGSGDNESGFYYKKEDFLDFAAILVGLIVLIGILVIPGLEWKKKSS